MNHRYNPSMIPARLHHRGRRLLPLMAFVLGMVGACSDQTPVQPKISSAALALIPGPVTAPLRVDPINPRYFSDGSKIVYLSGSHTWQTLKDRALNDPPLPFDYDAFLSFLVSHNHNFFRLWTWEQTYSWNNNTDGNKRYFTPFPWQRTGPGIANDGKPRFDFTKFDQAYFDRLRARVVAARDQGVYVAITLFDGWDVVAAFNATNGGFPYGPGNNVNGIGVGGVESQTLNNSAVTLIQDAYVRKVIDTVNDLENVLYEIANESEDSSIPWQYHMIGLIKQYEAGKPQRHPVGISKTYGGSDAALMNSDADWIAPAGAISASDGRKVVINDTDHSYYWTALKADGTDAQRAWAWKNLTVGASLLFMDPYLEAWPGRNNPNGTAVDPYWEPLRSALGYVRSYADRLDLQNTVPRSDLSSSGYCLAKVGAQYLAYQPNSGPFTVSVGAGTYSYEWFDAKRGTVAGTGSVTLSAGPNTFTPPFAGDAVLFLERASSSSPNQPPTLTAAVANPSAVTGTTTALSTSGSDDQGEPGLSYTWSTRSSPPAAVSFSSNGVNASKNTTATFSGPGTYALRVTARDGQGLAATNDVDVTVNSTFTSVSVAPASATTAPGATKQFSASGRDQFGVVLVNQPVFAWSTSGGGTIDAAGIYSAGMTPGGPFSITARSGVTSGIASVTVSNTSAVVVGESTILPTDDNGNGNLLVSQTVNLTTSATLRSVSFYVTNAAGKLRLGVYDASGPNGGPGNKRAETSEFTPVSGWNTASTPPVVLAAGTYWLAYFASDNALGFRKQSASAGSRLASVPYGVLPAAFPASPRTSGSKWSLFATFDLATAANQPPTLTGAIANPSVVTGTTTALSTSGSDDQGEPGLSYTWSTRSSPPAAVSFSSNGVNASKNTTATFSGPGTYALRVTVLDGQGLAATSDVDVTVNSTLASVGVAPASATTAPGATKQFSASGRDQFGLVLVNQPVFAWSTSGGGTIDAAGVYSAGMTPGGPFSITARSANTSGTASATITPSAPPSTVLFGETTVLPVDDDGNANLLLAQPTSLTQTVTIRSLSFYVATPAGKLRLGIYDATGPMGGPGAKRAETNEIAIGSAGWATGDVITPATLTPGTYWLAYLPSDNRLHFRKQPNSSNAKLFSFPYGPLPATFSTSPNTSTSHWSLFASGTP